MTDVLGIPKEATSLVEYDDCVNLLKGAVECSNWVSTVSPTYAQELWTHGSHINWMVS
ncbi:MAG: glycogen/starch synthase [Eubacteriales bacterium]